jgi:hypothetical protein
LPIYLAINSGHFYDLITAVKAQELTIEANTLIAIYDPKPGIVKKKLYAPNFILNLPLGLQFHSAAGGHPRVFPLKALVRTRWPVPSDILPIQPLAYESFANATFVWPRAWRW